ncbi:MAG TPA: branched-chain amino acid ABC transporter permease, partial [Pyrodictium sp.]|nr:branched-chain amino acid ABC transporter permease [Pyrodictium sp.]
MVVSLVEVLQIIVDSLAAPLGLQLVVTGLVYAALVLSLNIEYGWAGIPNFGKVAFIAIGAISTHIVYYLYVFPRASSFYAEVDPQRFTLVGLEPGDYPRWPWDAGSYNAIMFQLHIAIPYLQEHLLALFEFMFVSAALAAVLGAITGLVMTYPVVRLREDYLAILLLMFSFMLWNFLTAIPALVGGSQGFRITYEPLEILGGGNVDYGRLVMIIAVFSLLYLFVDRLTHSPYGRTLRAMRDDELAAATMGKNIARLRLETVVVGSLLAAIGGVAFVFILFPSVTPDLFKPEVTFMLIAMMLLGGAGNNVGAVVGVFAFLYIFRA